MHLLAVFCVATVASYKASRSRVVGGAQANEGQFPHQVYRFSLLSIFCTFLFLVAFFTAVNTMQRITFLWGYAAERLDGNNCGSLL